MLFFRIHVRKIQILCFLCACVLCSQVYSGWTDAINETLEKAKEVGGHAVESSCFWCEKTIAHAKRNFRSSIDDYDDQQVRVGDSFSNGKKLLFDFDTLLREAKNKDKTFKKVHDSWLHVEAEIEQLNDQFEDLVTSADELFSVLDKKADSIQDSDLRIKSKEKISRNRVKYQSRLAETKSSIKTLNVAKIKVIDMITGLEISYTLDTLEGRIETTLNEIDETITAVMADLASLSVESKALLGSS